MTSTLPGRSAAIHQPRPPIWPWLLLGAVTIVCLGSWLPFYADFESPNPDFFGYEEMARAIYHLQVPPAFKRMPVYPLAMGALAVVLPTAHPYLHAGLILNLMLSVASLWMLFLLARHWLANAAPAVVVLFAAAPVFSLMAGQPLLEPMLGFLVLLTFYLLARQSNFAYLAAMLASMTRYEAAVLIPIVWAVALHRQPRTWWVHSLNAFAAALPLLLWLVLCVFNPAAPEGRAYLEEMSAMNWSLGWRNIWLMLEPFPYARPIEWIPLLLAAALGLIVSLRRDPRLSLAILSYFLFYTAVHVAFNVYIDRYAYPVLFVVPLYAALGLDWLLRFVWQRLSTRRRLRTTACLLAGVPALAWMINGIADFSHLRLASWQHPGAYLLPAFAMIAAMGVIGWRLAADRLTRLTLALLLASGLTIPALSAAAYRAREQGYYRYENIQYHIATRWLLDHLPPGEQAATIKAHLYDYWTDGRLADSVVDLSTFTARTPEQFVDELRQRHINFVVAATYLRLPDDPHAPDYPHIARWYHLTRTDLLEPFRDGKAVASFEKVAELPVPPDLIIPVDPVCIYRLVGE